MNKLLALCLCFALATPVPAQAYSYGTLGSDNPFVEAMLRMMEIMGLINRGYSQLGSSYLSAYGLGMTPAFGGLSGLGGMPALGAMSGMGGYPGMTGWPGVMSAPGFSPMTAAGGIPGMTPWSGVGPVNPLQSGNWGGVPWQLPQRADPRRPNPLNGVWELNKGGIVMIRGDMARLYAERDHYQDYAFGFDQQFLWWRPRSGGKTSRYQYQLRDGHMMLRDRNGNVLLLKRRR